VKIWEQTYSEPESQANGAKSQNTSRWVERAVLVDSKVTVRSVEFSPHQFGLKLVSVENLPMFERRTVEPLFSYRLQSLLITSYAFTNV
jgi:hypothetical protein